MPNYSMNYGIKQSPWFSAFAVSMVLHGVALAFLTEAFFSNQPILPPIHLNSSTAVNTLTATLISIPSRHFDKRQTHLSVPDKQIVPATVSKKRTPDKTIKPEQAQKTAALGKQSSNHKKSKTVQHQAAKESKQLPAKKPDILANNPGDQRSEMRKKVAVAGQPDLLMAKAENPVNERQSTAQATNDQQSSQVASASLPPILKSRQPEYPEEARWEERAGKVTVKFKVSEQGRVIEPSIIAGSGHRDLDLAAIQAIQFWRFEPKKGQTGTQWYLYSFRFELN